MEMRKFIVEIHPDGRLTCCEYEEPRDAIRSARLAGFKRGLAHGNDRQCPECGCCCDYGRECCDLKGGNIDHPGGCKKL